MNIFKYTLHKELWLWLYKYPFKTKYNWPKWGIYNNIINHCFACDYLYINNINIINCKNCPLIPFKYKLYNTCLNGLYENFNASFVKKYINKHYYKSFKKQIKRRRKFAKKIAMLKVKKGVIYE